MDEIRRSPKPAAPAIGFPSDGSDFKSALPRQQFEAVACRGGVIVVAPAVPLLEDQPLHDALPGLQRALRQEHAAIGVTAARDAAAVVEFHLPRQAARHHQQVRVDDRGAVVGQPVHVLLPVALAPRVDARDMHLRRHVEELQAHVAPRQRVVVVLRHAARRPAIDSTERRQVGTVLRVGEVDRAQLEEGLRLLRIERGKCRVVQAVLDEVGQVVDLVLAQAEAARRACAARVSEAGRQRRRRAGSLHPAARRR